MMPQEAVSYNLGTSGVQETATPDLHLQINIFNSIRTGVLNRTVQTVSSQHIPTLKHMVITSERNPAHSTSRLVQAVLEY